MLEHSPSRSLTPSLPKVSTSHSARYQENKPTDYRMWQSGPSSLESGKTSIFTSGPSSIDSGKVSFNRNSGHSSLDSQRSSGSTIVQPRSILMLNGSPRGTPRHQIMRTRNAEQSSGLNTMPTQPATDQRPQTAKEVSNSENCDSSSTISNSTSNNSITLKVTTSNDGQNSLPNTKIVVQNTPAQSVITFENGKLNENSNVFIFSNETTTNEKGELIRKTLSKQHVTGLRNHNTISEEVDEGIGLSKSNQARDNGQHSCQDTDLDTCDSLSYKSSLSPDKRNGSLSSVNYNVSIDMAKLTKNLQNDSNNTMNNSRKLYIPVQPMANAGHLIYKNNVLKDGGSDTLPNSPSEDKALSSLAVLANHKTEMSGSVGNLRFYEKNSKDCLAKSINSNCELNNLRYDSSNLLANNLNSNTSLNGNSLVQILQKNSISAAVGSEPNLAHKDTNCLTTTSNEKSIQKDTLDRRLSLTREQVEAEDLFNFPSLTDLSFNFTSLAAQKILQGVSLNSLDTLVELNMAAAAAAAAAAGNVSGVVSREKPQNNQPTTAAVCTDFGLV